MIQKIATASALAAFGALPALAGNVVPAPVEPAPVIVADPVPIYDWTGFFVGAQIGYADVEADTGATSLDDDGFTYGLRAGYDYDFGTFVLGGIVQYDELDITLGEGAGAIDVENVLRVGARAGLDSGRNLFYLTAGYANADTDAIGDADGYFAGVGYEVFLTQNVTAGAELLYHEFDDFDDAPTVEADATTLALSVNYRF